jgi:hypothetical protein
MESLGTDVYSHRSGYKVSIVYQISFQFLRMHGHWLEEISSDFLSKHNGIYSINCVVLIDFSNRAARVDPLAIIVRALYL